LALHSAHYDLRIFSDDAGSRAQSVIPFVQLAGICLSLNLEILAARNSYKMQVIDRYKECSLKCSRSVVSAAADPRISTEGSEDLDHSPAFPAPGPPDISKF
jgi:hypothetical protein